MHEADRIGRFPTCKHPDRRAITMSADPQQMAYFRYSVIAPLLADEPDRTL
jgi:hypothetical protein